MARERASSGLPTMDDSLFVGPRVPDEIKRMIPHLTSIDKALFRKILQGRRDQKYRYTFGDRPVKTITFGLNVFCATLTHVHFDCIINLRCSRFH